MVFNEMTKYKYEKLISLARICLIFVFALF